MYMNAGVQIAQRGSLVIDYWLAASLPAETRGLFFPQHEDGRTTATASWASSSIHRDQARVIDQFPHLYPTRRDRLRAGRAHRCALHVGVCAVIGVLALYFLGARLRAGPPAPAPAACSPSTWSRSGTRGCRTPRSSHSRLLLAGLLALAQRASGR